MLYPSTSTLVPICLLKNCFFRSNLHILYKCIILFIFNICLLFLQFLHAYLNWFWEFQWLGSCFDLQRIHYQTWLKKKHPVLSNKYATVVFQSWPIFRGGILTDSFTLQCSFLFKWSELSFGLNQSILWSSQSKQFWVNTQESLLQKHSLDESQ